MTALVVIEKTWNGHRQLRRHDGPGESTHIVEETEEVVPSKEELELFRKDPEALLQNNA